MDVSAPQLNNSESLALSKKTVAAACKGIQNSLGFCIWDSRYWISVSVNKAWILDSNHRDSLSCIPDSNSNDSDHPQAILFFQIQDPTGKNFPYSGVQIPLHGTTVETYRVDSLYMQCPNVMENWRRSWKKPWKVMGFEKKKVNKRKLIE